MHLNILGTSTPLGQAVLACCQTVTQFKPGALVDFAPQEDATVIFRNRTCDVGLLDEVQWLASSVTLITDARLVDAAAIASQYGPCFDLTGSLWNEHTLVLPLSPVSDLPQTTLCWPSPMALLLYRVLAALPATHPLEQVCVTACLSAAESVDGIQTLAQETTRLLNGLPLDETQAAQRAFNLVTPTAAIQPNGYTYEENQWTALLKVAFPDLNVVPQLVNIPVFFGVGLSVVIESYPAISPLEAEAAFIAAGFNVAPQHDLMKDVNGQSDVFVSRVRSAPHSPDLAAWIMADVNHFAAHALVAWLTPWLEKQRA